MGLKLVNSESRMKKKGVVSKRRRRLETVPVLREEGIDGGGNIERTR